MSTSDVILIGTCLILVFMMLLGVESRLAALENAEIAKIKDICVHNVESNDE